MEFWLKHEFNDPETGEGLYLTDITDEVRLQAIDPEGCSCNDCLLGASVPIERATWEQVDGMLVGKIWNRTGRTWAWRPKA